MTESVNQIPKKFTIDRSKWRSGGLLKDPPTALDPIGKGMTLLLNDHGFMCCLGQIAGQCGVPGHTLMANATVQALEYPKYKSLMGFLAEEVSYADHHTHARNSDLALKAMTINDDPNLGTEEREIKLTMLFSKYGYRLEFVGEPVRPEKEGQSDGK